MSVGPLGSSCTFSTAYQLVPGMVRLGAPLAYQLYWLWERHHSMEPFSITRHHLLLSGQIDR
jgi:hypothetical protein